MATTPAPGGLQSAGSPASVSPATLGGQQTIMSTITAGGLPGATAASRYAGATVSGPPSSGTFGAGDWVIDQSGAVQICTAAGTPGTWAAVGAAAALALIAAETARAEAAEGLLAASSALTAETSRAQAAELVTANATSQVFSPVNYGAAGDGVTDDTTAVLAAFTAAAAAHGIVDLGRYTFLTSSPIPTFTGMSVRGSSQEGGSIVNNTSSIFTLTSGNYDLTWENCQLTASAGHIWDASAGPSLSFVRILGVKAVQSATGYSLWSQAAGSFIDCEIDKKCDFTMSAAATAAGWNMVKTGATSVCFDHLRTNAGNNPNVPFFNFDMNSAAGYMQDLSFKNIVIEQSPSGGIACAGVFGVTVEHVRGWDASAFSGNFLSFVTSASNYPCRNIRVTQSAQIQHGAGAGSWFDIYADANCTNIILDTDGTWGTQPAVSTPAMQTTILNMTGTSLNVPSVATFPGINVAGITGSTAASRYVGATASGHPATGAHLLGDWCPDQTGAIWICTAAGTPGTWIAAGPTAASPLAVGSGGTGGTTAATARANLGIAGSVNDPLQMGYNTNYTVMAPVASTTWTNTGAMAAAYSRLLAAGYASAHLGFNVAVTGGNCCVAYYTNSGASNLAKPTGGQLATSGVVATPAAGVAAIALGGSVTPNIGDWVGMSFDNVTVSVTSFSSTLNATTMGSGAIYSQAARSDTSCSTSTGTPATVVDAAAVSADLGLGIFNANIPSGTTITAVSVGVGYTISANVTATASSQTFIVGPFPLPATPVVVTSGIAIKALIRGLA